MPPGDSPRERFRRPDNDHSEGTADEPWIQNLQSREVSQATRSAGSRKCRSRMPIEKLALGLYVAEPDGIWTPIGTVSEKRISEYRDCRKPRKP